MEKDNINILTKRFTELSLKATYEYTPSFTDFLDLSEQSLLSSLKLPSRYTFFGGYDDAERKMACFYDEDCYYEPVEFPAVWLHIAPSAPKFAQELSHRDFLGALMNLGLKRSVFGDLLLYNNSCYVYTCESMANYVTENLESVSRTKITCNILDSLPEFAKKEPEEVTVIAPSNRIDALISAVYNVSRSDSLSLISSGKVFINSTEVTQNHKTLTEDDIVSVRGHGRFVFVNITDGTTRSGKLRILIKKY